VQIWVKWEGANPTGSMKDRMALSMVPRLAREEGLFGGISSGANVWMALQHAKRLASGARIVTTIGDSGLKYLRGDLYR
jgi:cysteine synthase A